VFAIPLNSAVNQINPFYISFQTSHRVQYRSAKGTESANAKTKHTQSDKNQGVLPFAVSGTSRDGDNVDNSAVSSDKYSATHQRQKDLTTAVIINLIGEAMLPLRLVECTGFKKFMNIVDPCYTPPSRRTVTRRVTSNLQLMKDAIKHDLEKLAEDNLLTGSIHATTDLWSSRSLEPIIGVKFHFFDVNFKLNAKTVAYRHFGSRHTGENISAAFGEILLEYGIAYQDIGYVITDNASNMLKAFSIFSEEIKLADETARGAEPEIEDVGNEDDYDVDASAETDDILSELNVGNGADGIDVHEIVERSTSCRLSCVAHTLQLSIKDALKCVPLAEKIIKESNAVVVFFRRSLFWNEELRKLSGGLTLLADVPTRWNSSLIMLKRLSQSEVWKAVCDTLFKAKTTKGSKGSSVPRFTVSRAQILDIISLLEPFEEATIALQGDGVTISRVIPALVGIDETLATCKTQLTGLQRQLRRCIYERFQDLICKPEYIVSTLLDCRYKLVPFAVTSAGHNTQPNLSTLKPVSSNEARALLLQFLSNTTTSTTTTVTSHSQQNGSTSTADVPERQELSEEPV
jgi:hypothetical protein